MSVLCALTLAAPGASGEEWDEIVAKQKIAGLAVTQCLEEVIAPQNYASHEGEEEMQACLERKGVVTAGPPASGAPGAAGYGVFRKASSSAQETPLPYEIPDMERLVRNLEAAKTPSAPEAAAPPDSAAQEVSGQAEGSSQGSLYVRSSKKPAGEKKAKPVFLNR